jgi:hypothetical protein
MGCQCIPSDHRAVPRGAWASSGLPQPKRRCPGGRTPLQPAVDLTVVAKKIAWTDRSGPPKSVLFQLLEHLNRSIFRVREC